MNVTSQANLEIRKRLSKEQPYFRVIIEGGGCSGFSYSFDIDNKKPDDVIIEDLILIDSESWFFLKNSTLDYVNDLTGQYFKVLIPEAKSFCGCGTSFSL